ncbi:MAG: GGDEF domain-containing protein [Desulfuromonadaceae bacterium]|nr:GGDEF domain-containing protein [Desulfuromonadaceae bacterium]
MTKFESVLIRHFRFLERRGQLFNVVIGLVCAVLIGVVDYLSSNEYMVSFFYLLPIAFVTWFAGKKAGIINSLICAVIWTINSHGSSLIALTWNMVSTLGIFCTMAITLSSIHQLFETKDSLSRTDPLTGVMNIRAFSGLVEYEILHLQRRGCPFSIAYLDLDNFKKVNDCHGHKKGNELLKAVVICLAQSLRRTDVVARVGGDEFTIFLPETGPAAVKLVMQKVREQLIETARNQNLTTTFSIGVLTCTHGSCNFDEIISIADKLMYEVKVSGKNNIQYAILPR